MPKLAVPNGQVNLRCPSMTIGTWIDILLQLDPRKTPIPFNSVVREVQQKMITHALDATKGNVSQAAVLLGMKRDALRYAIRSLELTSLTNQQSVERQRKIS